MSLRSRLIRALASSKAGAALADGIKTRGNLPPLTSTNLRTDTVGNVAADAEARLDALEARVNAITASDAEAAKLL